MTNNSTQTRCRKILNYTRHSTCWFRQPVPWAESWFIVSSKATRWRNSPWISIQVCKEFSSQSRSHSLLLKSMISFHSIDRPTFISIHSHYPHSHQPLTLVTVNVGVVSTTSLTHYSLGRSLKLTWPGGDYLELSFPQKPIKLFELFYKT